MAGAGWSRRVRTVVRRTRVGGPTGRPSHHDPAAPDPGGRGERNVSTIARKAGATLTVVVVGVGAALTAATPAVALAVRPFQLGYSGEVFGDFIEIGNGSMRCPDATDPVDPGGTPIATCDQAQQRSTLDPVQINDSYYMRYADVDGATATYNSSRSQLTIPSGAKVAFARLIWAGDTGTIKLADGTLAPAPACNDRQFLDGAGTAQLPAGQPGGPVTLTVGTAATPVTPATVTRDPVDAFSPSNPQYYSAFADVTRAFASAPTGVALP